MSNLIDMAAIVSRTAHQAVGQVRKYTGEPYWHHPMKVAAIVRTVPDFTEEMIAAAYLHDVLEDTKVTEDDLRAMFGLGVMHTVKDLSDAYTDPSHGNRKARKVLECERLANCSYAVQTVKYADLIDNTRSIVEHDPGFAQIYLREKRNLLNVMVHGDQALWQQAWALCVEGEVQTKQILEERRETTYKVYVGNRRKATVFSEKDAWTAIEKHCTSIGSIYEVRDYNNEIRPEFVPY